MASRQGLARALRGLGACSGSKQSLWTSPIAVAASCLAASSSFGAARGGVASMSMAPSSSASPGALFSSFPSSSHSFASSASPPVTGAASASVSTAAESDADEESLERIRSRIFGTEIGDGRPSGRKVLRKKLVGDVVASYYPDNPAAQDPLFVDLDDVK